LHVLHNPGMIVNVEMKARQRADPADRVGLN
jgi:hypothetical protein